MHVSLEEVAQTAGLLVVAAYVKKQSDCQITIPG
jgi:hypothetical protein